MRRFSRFHDNHQVKHYAQQHHIPSKDILTSGLFASHYFDINPTLEPITDLFTAKPFSSKFIHPIDGKEEHILVLGLTGKHDGQNHRQKTDFVLVIDHSGSMGEGLNWIAGHHSESLTQPDKQLRNKMELAIEATKRIFDLVEDDEEIGILMFDSVVDIIEEIKPKHEIDRNELFERLGRINPRGGTDFGIGLSAAVSMIPNKRSNQRIIFLTDAIPTVGASTSAIREMAEEAYVKSNGRLGVTYIGVGLSFDTGSCAELSRGHSTSVSSISNLNELEETLQTGFNYEVSPIGFDLRIGLLSEDYAISEVYGGDSDYQREQSLIEFRTLTASAVGVEGIKGSVLIIYLQPLRPDIGRRASVEISVELTPFGETESQRQVYEYFLNEEPIAVTEKAYALSVYYRTVLGLLPERRISKTAFRQEEMSVLTQLQGFLKGQRPEITARLENEIKVVSDLIAINAKMNHKQRLTNSFSKQIH
jgi:hypothetical protein